MNADTKQLADILRSANRKKHVQKRAHRHSHIIVLVTCHNAAHLAYHVHRNGRKTSIITCRNDDNLIEGLSVSSMLSD